MAVVTSQQIQKFFTSYGKIDVTFTKDVASAVGLIKNQIYLKAAGLQHPCALYSSSFTQAKLVMSLKPHHLEKLRTNTGMASLHLGFQVSDRTDPVNFFIGAKLRGLTKYVSKSPDLYFLTLEFNKRPPDDMIEIMGRFLETNINAAKRKNERISWTKDVAIRMGLSHSDTAVAVQGIVRKCLVRDVSFGGCKVLIPGIARFLQDKPALVSFSIINSTEKIKLPGKILRAEPVEGRKDIAVAALQFQENTIPLDFKMKINDILQSNRKA